MGGSVGVDLGPKSMSAAGELAGLPILVTRAQHQSGVLAGMLRERGAVVEEVPTIEIRPPADFSDMDAALGRMAEYDWLILTSVNGAEAMFGRLNQLALPRAGLSRMQVCAIGPATRRSLEKRGIEVAVVPGRYVAESVVEALRGRARGKRVLLLRAREARDVIPRELREAGAQVDVVAAYETLVPAGARGRLMDVLGSAARPRVITFTSSSTARHLVALLGGRAAAREQLQGITPASIGPVTSATLREAGLEPGIEAAEFTITGLVEAICDWRMKL
ncbi:MAG: uroporphyrinogen-III synthase [Acidobacteria bacterium]|nr:uroporphyrinogen-III synthase [Acidobacteriota bacterium]